MKKPHGKKARYKEGCRCTWCSAWAGHRPIPVDDGVRWPFHHVRKHRGDLAHWYTDDEIEDMRKRGLDDETADTVAVKILGLMPYQIWPGWLEAGFDNVEDEEDMTDGPR